MLRELLTKADGTGILQQLNDPYKALSLSSRLHALHEVLIPQEVRSSLTGAASSPIKRVVIVPNGSLALLPFEVLVTDNAAAPVYLLDQAPPLVSAPSAAVFLHLVQKRMGRPGPSAVFTLGDPDYDRAETVEARSMMAQRARYVKSRGSLARLQFSAKESSWISRVFSESGMGVVTLRGADATESSTRASVAGKEFVHLACHGLVEQEFGNLFGALAVTPATNFSDPADDGFLTLAETYDLDLKRDR